MSILIEKRRIDDPEKKEAILEMLSDKYCRAILTSTMNVPKSAMDLATDTKIPISTIYRRLQMLHDGKLVSISGEISDDGKKLFLYKSKVGGITIAFNGDQIEVETIPNLEKELRN
jgi:DNA-binding transcriptional ArsR family regulator